MINYPLPPQWIKLWRHFLQQRTENGFYILHSHPSSMINKYEFHSLHFLCMPETFKIREAFPEAIVSCYLKYQTKEIFKSN